MWFMLELHKIIKMSHGVLCPIVFPWFYERGLQGGVLVFKVMKNDHVLVFLAVCVLFPKPLLIASAKILECEGSKTHFTKFSKIPKIGSQNNCLVARFDLLSLKRM